MSKKNIYIKRTIKVVSMVLLIAVSTLLLQRFVLLHYDHNTMRFNGFYLEDEKSLDVVLIGASEVYADYSPDLAYEKYGFTSYDFCIASSPLTVYKTEIQEIMRTQKPKLIVIEINGALYSDDENSNKEANIRNVLDNIPFNDNRDEFIKRYVPKNNRLEYYFPIIKYHSAWNDYPQAGMYVIGMAKQAQRGYTYLKGFKTITDVYKPNTKTYNDVLANDNKTASLTSRSEQELRELAKYCKDEGINVLFARFPHVVHKNGYARFKRANQAEKIINEYGFDFLNFEKYNQQIGLDLNNDFYNVDHMNIYGAEKFTDYFAGVLSKNYGITPTEGMTDEQKEKWKSCVEYNHTFIDYCDSLIKDGDRKEVQEDYDTMVNIDKKYGIGVD